LGGISRGGGVGEENKFMYLLSNNKQINEKAIIEAMDAEKVYARLLLAQDKKDFYEQSLKILREENWIWIDTWQNWTQNYLYEEMEYWLASLPIYIKEDLELFDDCPICQAMKEGKTSFEELKESFEKAKEQGAIVDGDTDYFKTK